MCRSLKADEIDVRVQSFSVDNQTKECKGATLLLYKNARVDMDILDEEYGKFGWQRTHAFKDGKLYCTVSVWDEQKQMWISREDVGTESNTEAEKGQASDSFKRANVNFGIGRELYTAPFIYIKADQFKAYKRTQDKSGNPIYATYDKFSVADVDIKDKQIIGLSIRNDTSKKIVFTYGTIKGQNQDDKQTDKQTDKQDQPKPQKELKTGENEPTMTVEEASAFVIDHELHKGEELGKVWRIDFASIPKMYETGSTDLRWAIDTLNEAVKQSKAKKNESNN